MEPGPNDVPQRCESCGSVQLHRPDPAGVLHCLGCIGEPKDRASGDAGPLRIDVRPRAMPLVDQARNAIVIVVLLFVIVAVYVKACNAH